MAPVRRGDRLFVADSQSLLRSIKTTENFIHRTGEKKSACKVLAKCLQTVCKIFLPKQAEILTGESLSPFWKMAFSTFSTDQIIFSGRAYPGHALRKDTFGTCFLQSIVDWSTFFRAVTDIDRHILIPYFSTTGDPNRQVVRGSGARSRSLPS